MELKSFFTQDRDGNVISGAMIYVYLAGTMSLATGLKDKHGNDLPNPFSSDADGLAQFAAPNGEYDMRVLSSHRENTRRVQFFDINEAGILPVSSGTGLQSLKRALDQRVIHVGNIQALRALDADKLVDGQQVSVGGYHVSGDGGGGVFHFDASDTENKDNGVTCLVISGGGRLKRHHSGMVTSAQAGVKRDGKKEDRAIQNAINVAFDDGISLHLSHGAHTHGKLIIIPHDMVITGEGMHESYFYYDYEDGNKRGVVVGTYGPAESYVPAYNPEHVRRLLRASGTRLYVSDTEPFNSGDVVGIEGTRQVRSTNLFYPNHVNEVVSVASDHLVVRHLIDDDYDGGRVVCLNQPDALNTSAHTDATGRIWNLHVAINTRISDIGFRQKPNSGWPAVTLSTYRTEFRRCSFGSVGSYGAVAGNPVARTRFLDCEFLYTKNAWEFAYYAHDNFIMNPRVMRVGDASPDGTYVCHANTGEGAKRIHVFGGVLDDGTVSSSDVTALQTGPESDIRDLRITTMGRGVWGDHLSTMSGCTIIWGAGAGVSGFRNGYANDNVIISRMDADGVAMLVGDGHFSNNILRSFDGSRHAVDIIRKAHGPSIYSDQLGNRTFKSTPVSLSTYSNQVDSNNGIVEVAALGVPAGSIGSDDMFSFEAIISPPDGARISLLLNDTVIHSFVRTGEGDLGITGKIIFASGLHMDDRHYRLLLSMTDGTSKAASDSTSISWSAIEKFSLAVTGLTDAVTFRRHYAKIERLAL